MAQGGRWVVRPPPQNAPCYPPPQQQQQQVPRHNGQQPPGPGAEYKCFKCGIHRHFIKDCPQNKQHNPQNKGKQRVQVRQGRLNLTNLVDMPHGAPVTTYIFSIHNRPAIFLFDSGASHSFICWKFSGNCGLIFCHTKGAYMISTPGGKIASNQISHFVPIKLGSKVFPIDLIILGLEGIVVILGVNWIT